MASLTLRGLNDRFPEGTVLTIRPRSNYGSSTPPVPGQAPLGSATDTQTVSGDAVTFVGLADDTAYVVTDSSGSKYLQAGTQISHGGFERTVNKGAAGGYAGLDSAETFTKPLAITPDAGVALTLTPLVSADGLKVNVPAYADATHSALHLTDVGNRSAGPHMEVDAYGLGNVVDIHWFPASPVGTAGGSALGLHIYRDPGPGQAGFIIDNTDAGAAIKIKNTQGSNNPNGWGHGDFLQLFGYGGASAHGTSDGTITSGTAILTSASGTFAKSDEGKPIRVPGAGAAAGNLDTTILSFQSATQVTLAANASTSVTTANYIYPQLADGQALLAKITGNPPGFGNISTTNTGALRFINKQTGVSNLSASPWSFETDAGQCFALQVYQPTGSQACVVVNNAGTGAALVTQLSGTNKFIVDKDGAITRCGPITLTGATADGDLILGTTTGTKIGTSTSQKWAAHGATPIAQQTVTGSRAANAALADLLTKLAAKGIIADGTSA